MNSVAIAATLLLLGVIVLATAYQLILPYMREREARQRLDVTLKDAITLANAIEGVVVSGPGSESSLYLNIPDHVTPAFEPNATTFLCDACPVWEGVSVEFEGEVVEVRIEPRGTATAVVVNSTGEWRLENGGLAYANSVNLVTVSYKQPMVITIGWNRGGG